MTFCRYLEDGDVHVVDCAGSVDLEVGLARLAALEQELAARPAGGRKLLVDFRRTAWASAGVHQELSARTRRVFGLDCADAAVKVAFLHPARSGLVTANEAWFVNEREALDWLGAPHAAGAEALQGEAEVFEGRCQCGAVAYRVSGESRALFACHCVECQRQSSSAFGMALWVEPREVEVSGRLQVWTRHTPGGRQLCCSFCPTCGTRVFHQMNEQGALLSIKPGTLDDTSRLRPVGHIWWQSAQPWVELAPQGDVPCLVYPGNPESFEALFERWRVAKRRPC